MNLKENSKILAFSKIFWANKETLIGHQGKSRHIVAKE